ncbi:MAG TPA: hypothetical protein VLV54_22290 [Thermoanaerobaculia bacterium]|nr:hypothetical protein [Thermoanaerobaculia bacterium]
MPADRAVLQRVLNGSGVERTPVPPESSYLAELARAVLAAVFKAVGRGASMMHLSRQTLIAAVLVLVVLAFLLVLRTLLPRLRLGRRSSSPGRLAVEATPGPALDLDAAGWRAELDRRLAAGRSAEALEAAWWWLARSLAGNRVMPDWTSRDLLIRGGREDLAVPIRRLDTLIYGSRRPAPEEVRSLVNLLEEGLA